MVYRVFAGQVQFHDGVDEVAPGITVHKIGGHTKGLQCVRVPTARGHVVLASDADPFLCQHIDTRRVFRVLYNLADMVEGYNTLERLASSKAHVIPGTIRSCSSAIPRRPTKHRGGSRAWTWNRARADAAARNAFTVRHVRRPSRTSRQSSFARRTPNPRAASHRTRPKFSISLLISLERGENSESRAAH